MAERSNKNIDRIAATIALDESVGRVRLVSPAREAALNKLGVFTVRDLLAHYPRRYIDLTHIASVASARIGESVTISGTVHEVKLKRPRPNLPLVEITLVDQTGTLMVTCFRQQWLADQLRAGMRIAVAGKVEFNYGFKRMTNPFLEVLDDGSNPAAGMVIPVHPATEKITTAWMRRLVENALDLVEGVSDPIPLDIRVRNRLMSRGGALRAVHFPISLEEAKAARRRLAFEELLLLELFLMLDSRRREKGKTPTAHTTDGPRLTVLGESLPFVLTDEQADARDEILAAMRSPHAANHMLLGDVGTGKTVVAAHAVAACADTGGQALFMAPTEVLARQHALALGPLFEAAGITYEVLTGATTHDEREGIIERFAAGTVDVLVGTHALLENDVVGKNVTLVIIDEQQRFGVDQRTCLLEKGSAPDALYLTATPIPRTLALALFGNLTLSYIRHAPAGHAQRTTKVYQKNERGYAYDAARMALSQGQQVYVVCPLVGKDAEDRDAKATRGARGTVEEEEQDNCPVVAIESDGDMGDDDVSAATQQAKMLAESVFTDYNVGLLHGKMSHAEKQQTMQQFRANEIQVLVATTVIEVGVDVPNATVMIIEDADRFGLSQLHQLRGRVGRGGLPGQVFLVSASKQQRAIERLSAMENTDDGYELASYDLSLRREGDILGNRQSGASALKLVNVVRDGRMIEAAHRCAQTILEDDPDLASAENAALAREVRCLFKNERAVVGG